MKSKYIFLFSALAVSLGTAGIYLSSDRGSSKKGDYQQRTSSLNLKMGHARSAAGAFEYYKSIKSNINTGNIELSDLIASQTSIKEHSMIKSVAAEGDIKWESMGPDNQGGRTYAVLFEKSDPTIIFAGAVSGGLWKTTTGGTSWKEIGDFDNINISCIHQSSNGTIYFGTGEDIANTDGSGNSGFMGQGVWKSTDKGITWTHIASTLPTNTNNSTIEFAFVSEIITAPSDPNIIYVATNRGVRKSIDGGENWTNPMVIEGGSPTPIVGQGYNVDIASDGTIVCDINSKVYISTNGGDTFINHSTKSGLTNANKLPNSGIGRMSIDIAPSDPNYIYVQCSSPAGGVGFEGVYRTTNKGDDWSVYVPGRVSGFNIFAQDPSQASYAEHQGWYDNVIKVHPTNKDKIYCGGIDLWSFSPTTSFERISMWYGESTETYINPYYVHADQHGIAFHPNNPDVIIFANDGGLFKTENGGLTFKEINKGYVTTQYYALCFGPTGVVMGGLQDNGTQYINFEGNTAKAAIEVMGGDGFDAAISQLNDNIFFASSYFGAVRRSSKKGEGFSSFFNNRAETAMKTSAFNTKFAIWETKHAENFAPVATFTATSPIAEGSTVNRISKTSSIPFTWIADADYAVGDVVTVPDPVQNRLVVGARGSVWMTTQALDFTTNPHWYRIAFSGASSTAPYGSNDPLSNTDVICFAFTKGGETLYIGQADGGVYRIDNLNTVRISDPVNNDTLSGELGASLNRCKITVRKIAKFNRIVTSLAVDPQNGNNLVATLGRYGASYTDYVYVCTNATSAPSNAGTANFTSIQGSLPPMPVYSSVIDYQKPDVIIIGTEYGVYSTSDGGSTWQPRITGMGKVPVFAVRQQALPYNECWNSGMIYAGTHGKGVFRTDALVGVKENLSKINVGLDLKVYPNPVTETASINFSIERTRKIEINVYDLNGRVVKSYDLDKKPEGLHQFTFTADDLNIGTYFVSINGGEDYKKVTKFVVVK